ncbi:hypothetical protein BLNAU_19080 [Blattamonas nauphoetae]|uniref:Uncharacterized protein n=1 Tax=Blattamonas nauphoetae TaxID=2049346 RepID=A0ABQ9X2K3_9EUKA|nr:hypothetical protein BLNAU_19080 [Blattamonas nauphoetae]
MLQITLPCCAGIQDILQLHDNYPFNEEMLWKASIVFSSITSSLNHSFSMDEFIHAIANDAPHPAAVYLSLPSTPFQTPQSIRDVFLHEVLIPMEPSLVQISRNRVLLSLGDECLVMFMLLYNIFAKCVFHRPTQDFICSSRIPIVFQSLLTEVEHEEAYQSILEFLADDFRGWKRYGVDSAGCWTRETKFRCNVCRFDERAPVFVPSIDFQRISHTRSSLSRVMFIIEPAGHRLHQPPSWNPFHTSHSSFFGH